TFQLTRFDPNTRVCSPLQTPVTQIVALQAAGPDTATATTTPVTLTAPGIYNWTATYSGDVNFAPFGPVGCGDAAEQVTIVTPTPSILVDKTADPTSRP